MSSKRPGQRKNRAVALVTTMAALAVIIMLVGAFLATRQSLIAMSRYSTEEQACRDSLRSVADYCRFRLEGRELWGRVAGEPEDSVVLRNNANEVVLSLTALTSAQARAKPEFDGLKGDAFFEGTAPRPAVSLQMSVSNNLDQDDPNAASGVAGKTCILRIRATRGAATETVEVLLRRAAFFDSTVAASGEIEINADAVDFSSNDSLRNQIRSKSKISLPDIPDITFTPDDEMQTPEKGTIWAKGEIEIDGVSSQAKLDQAAEATGGEFLALAPTEYSVPELLKADLDADTSKPIRMLSPAVYDFRLQRIKYLDENGNELYREIPMLVILAPETEAFREFHFVEGALLEPLDPLNPVPLDHVPDPTTVTIEIGGNDISGTSHEDKEFEIDGGPKVDLPLSPLAAAGLELAAEEDNRVEGGGGADDFKVRSTALPPAQLLFKDNDPDPEHPQEGTLSVKRDLVIQGAVTNCGKLLAGRDVQLMPHDVTVDKLESTSDLAVYGGRDVVIAPVFNKDQTFREDEHRYFAFKGLVYAQKDFKFLSSLVRNGRTVKFNRKLYIEGALVARDGDVLIQGNETVELKYNREYLDDLLEKRFDEDHVQIEELSWRPL